jgi:ECF sigma factor
MLITRIRLRAPARQDKCAARAPLINEAYLRLAGSGPVAWNNRSHFFALAARMMRRIVVDHARARRSLRRGGQNRLVSLEEA